VLLVLGIIGLLLLAAGLIIALSVGSVIGSILFALVFLYNVWNTYDTFVVKECWTLYLEEVK
jgi:hypothetical protein